MVGPLTLDQICVGSNPTLEISSDLQLCSSELFYVSAILT